MICEKTVKRFCKDYKNIENYELAINDNTQTWDCHHRKEIDENKLVQQLIDCGLYYGRPACELIFLKKGEHRKLHMIGENHPLWGKHHSEETRNKISENHADVSGKKHPMWGKHHSEETKGKISESMKGKNHHMYGKRGKDNPLYGSHQSEEHRQKRSESMKGKNKGKHRVYHPDGTYHMEKNIQ